MLTDTQTTVYRPPNPMGPSAEKPVRFMIPRAPNAVGGADAVIDSEFRETLAMAEDLQRQLENSAALNRELTRALENALCAQKTAESLAENRLSEISRMQKETAVLQNDKEGLTVELGASEEERNEAFREIMRLKETVANEGSVIKTLRDEGAKIESDCRKKEQEAEKREKELHEKLAKSEQRIERLDTHLKERSKELYSANETIESLKKQKEELENRVSVLERSRTALSSLHNALLQMREKVPNGSA